MNQFLQNWKSLIYFIIVCTLVSCSKDSPDENPGNQSFEDCKIESPDLGCSSVTLEGTEGWVKILKQGSLADPLFLYLPGDKSEPYGTVTIGLENSYPTIKINDAVLDDYLVTISQNSDGSNSFCQTGKNIESVDTDNDSPTTLKVNNKYEFPFYIKFEANVCF